MKYVNPRIEYLEQEPGFSGMLKQIELAGRTAYKSEDRITDDSAPKFVEMLKERGHWAPFEQGTVYLMINALDLNSEDYSNIILNPYTIVQFDGNKYYITTNYRVILENKWEHLLKYQVDKPDENFVKRYTYRIICSRAISLELVRHRVFSFVQESTRYCNYSKDKFGGELTFIIPSWVSDLQEGDHFDKDDTEADKIVQTILDQKHTEKTMMLVCMDVACEATYLNMLKIGCTPQQARDVLTNGLKTEIVMTGTEDQWRQFFKLRSPKCKAKGVHPDMAVIADLIYSDMRDNHGFKKNEPQS